MQAMRVQEEGLFVGAGMQAVGMWEMIQRDAQQLRALQDP